MASLIAKLWHKLQGRKAPVSVMLIGLDNSGKTSILESLTACQWHSQTSGGQAPSTSSRRSPVRPAWAQSSMGSPTGGSGGSDPVHDHQEGLTATPNGWPQVSEAVGERGQRPAPTIGYNYERIHFRGRTVNVLDFSGQAKYRSLWQEFLSSVDGIIFVIDSSDLIRLVVARDELETLLGHGYFGSLGQSSVLHKQQPQFQQKQITISQGRLIQAPLDGGPGGDQPRARPRPRRSSGQQQQRGQEATRRTRTKVPILLLANKSDLSNSVDIEVIAKALNLSRMLDRGRHPWLVQPTSVQTNEGIFEGLSWLLDEIATSTGSPPTTNMTTSGNNANSATATT